MAELLEVVQLQLQLLKVLKSAELLVSLQLMYFTASSGTAGAFATSEHFTTDSSAMGHTETSRATAK
jgi:hypothetical protein